MSRNQFIETLVCISITVMGASCNLLGNEEEEQAPGTPAAAEPTPTPKPDATATPTPKATATPTPKAACTEYTNSVETYAGAGYTSLEYAFNQEAVAQSFTLSSSGKLYSLMIFGGTNESAGQMDFEIWTDSSGSPGSLIAKTTVTSLSTTSAFNSGSLASAGVSLEANTTYWAVFRYIASNELFPTPGKFTTFGDATNRYANGSFKHYRTNTGAWGASPYSSNVDLQLIVRTCTN
jgi:hypothetical protein